VDTIKQYLKEISSIPRILLEDQNKLFMITDEVKDNNKQKPEIKEARNRIVEGNLRLVIFIAKSYKNYGLSLMDVIQEGNLGLLKAVENYDIKQGISFSSYAYQVIVSYIIRAINKQARLIYIPEYKLLQLRKYKTLKQNKGTMEDDFSKEELLELNLLSEQEVISMDKEILLSHGEKSKLIDLIQSKDKRPDEVDNDNIMDKYIEELLLELTSVEKYVIIHRFGFEDGISKSYQKISNLLHLSKEGVRKIEQRAIQKLKSIHLHQGVK